MKARSIWLAAVILVVAAGLAVADIVFLKGGKTVEKVVFAASDGLAVTGDLYLTRDEEAPFILLFHQARYSRGEYTEIAPRLNRLGYNCLAVDQRSGGSSNGVANETSARAKEQGLSTGYADAYPDLEAAVNYIAGRFAPSKLIVWGSSYSASLVLILAAEHPDEIQAVLAFSPGEYFRYQDQSIGDYAAMITQPTFITSAKSEEKVSRELAERIGAAGSVLFVPEEQGVHGSSALNKAIANNGEYWRAVESFLKTVGK